MENVNNNNSKKIVLLIIAVGILIVAVVGVTFAFFTYSKIGTKDNKIETGTISFVYLEGASGLTLTNMFPMTDAVGEIQASKYTFSVSGQRTGSGIINYTVKANAGSVISGKTAISNGLVHMKLTGSGTGAGSFSTAAVPTFPATIATGSINSTSEITHTYDLRMWISDAVVISDTDTSIEGKTIFTTTDYEKLYFSMRIDVSALST